MIAERKTGLAVGVQVCHAYNERLRGVIVGVRERKYLPGSYGWEVCWEDDGGRPRYQPTLGEPPPLYDTDRLRPIHATEY